MNYFELFNIPVSLKPDQQQLKKRYYELSRQYHPDFYTKENDWDQAEALEKASDVNKAYKTFLNPDNTIKYVLQQKGLLEEEEKYQLPQDFLMEVLELNEQLLEAKMEEDIAATNQVKSSIANLNEEIYQPVKTIIEGYKEGESSDADLLKVKDYYFKKKYLDRILATM
ncbi:MAG: chaperone protein HscB [Segetibacter sp.]|nr:chaperone protein HscB [Segetibacter sp.]